MPATLPDDGDAKGTDTDAPRGQRDAAVKAQAATAHLAWDERKPTPKNLNDLGDASDFTKWYNSKLPPGVAPVPAAQKTARKQPVRILDAVAVKDAPFPRWELASHPVHVEVDELPEVWYPPCEYFSYHIEDVD